MADAELSERQLDRLDALLDRNDTEAGHLFARHRQAMQACLGNAAGDIARCLDLYDYPDALQLLRLASASLQTDGSVHPGPRTDEGGRTT